jgi:DNA-binding response OmpR family regulator
MDGTTDVPTVLVVDDDEEHLELLEIWLADDCRVRTASDGRGALEAFDSTVDVVLLDRRMPGMSGDDVLTRLRSRPGYCRVVMVTGVVPEDDAVALPFDDYLLKPLSREEVRGAVETALRHANYGRLQDEIYTVASRIGILETHIPQAELERNDDCRALKERFSELQAEFDSLTEDFSDWEYWNEFERAVAADD